MHIVYKIIFTNRRNNHIFPFSYIGSKSNCSLNEGKIIDKNGKVYVGSTKHKLFRQLIKTEPYVVEILYETYDDYHYALEQERYWQIHYDVVANAAFFNLSIASENTYTNPEYATMKHVTTGKIARIRRDHPKILAGEWVGVTKGRIQRPEEIAKKKELLKEKNPFFGKHHSLKTRQIIREKAIRFYAGEKGKVNRQIFAKRVSQLFSGKPKSEEHKKKISRPGFKVIKNSITNETRRISCDEVYDTTIWKNPAALKQVRATCNICGITSVKGNIVRWHNNNCRNIK